MRPFSYCKLEIFLPASHLSPLETALRQVDAGHIGAYDSCLSYSPVTGCWRPLAGTSPYLGREGQISSEPELKGEVTCRTERVDETIAAGKAQETTEFTLLFDTHDQKEGMAAMIEKRSPVFTNN